MGNKQRVVDRLLARPDCDNCNNNGLFLAENTDRGQIEIQRCDSCKRFDSDLDAWRYVKPGIRAAVTQVEMKEVWYKKQIMGLYLIIDDMSKKEFMITREYVKEKLRMILKNGINFHPTIKERVGLK